MTLYKLPLDVCRFGKQEFSAWECRYSHGGDLAYVGSDKAVMQIPKFGLLRGSGAFLLWRGYETFRQISFRNKCLVAFDTLRSKVFGRDIEFGETDM